jgi:hypothetical protein
MVKAETINGEITVDTEGSYTEVMSELTAAVLGVCDLLKKNCTEAEVKAMATMFVAITKLGEIDFDTLVAQARKMLEEGVAENENV